MFLCSLNLMLRPDDTGAHVFIPKFDGRRLLLYVQQRNVARPQSSTRPRWGEASLQTAG